MSLDTDFHSHVSRSSALGMVLAAKEKGLRALGLSEHVFQMREARPLLQHLPEEGPLLSFAEYIADVRQAAEQEHFDTRLGLEVDFIPGKNEAIQSFVQPYTWDFLIGSVHEIDGTVFEAGQHVDIEEGRNGWLSYFALLREAVRSGYFSFISHPMRMRVANPHLPPTFDEELERLAAEAAGCDIALEMNGYDMQRYPSLVRRLAKACKLHNAPVSVGSDAHNPRQVAAAHAQTAELLHEVDIHVIRTWKKREPEEYRF